jgi:hypothetical protein
MSKYMVIFRLVDGDHDTYTSHLFESYPMQSISLERGDGYYKEG